MIQINLIPDVKREYLRARHMRDVAISLSVLASILAGVVILLMALVLSLQVARNFFADQNIKSEYEKLSSVQDLGEMVTIQNQLGLISSQHASKTVDSRLFSVLQAINPNPPNDVKFTTISLDPDEGTLNFEGLADGGYNAVETLTKTIQNTNVQYSTGSDGNSQTEPLATEVMVGETSYGVGSDNKRVLRFEMSVSFLEDLFTNRLKSVKIIGPTKSIDVTDSKLRVPSSLFSAPASDEGEQ